MLGLTWTVRFIGRPFHLLLVVVTVAAVVPALLTTRVDTHRLVLLEIPIFLWAGMGLAHAIRIATACRVPPALLHGSALALMLLTAAEDSALLYHRAPPHHPVAAAVVDALNADDGPVLLVPVMDFRDLGSIVLDLADRQRSDPTCSDQVLERGLAHQLSDLGGVTDEAYEVMRSAAVRHAVYLVPDSRFEDAAARAKANGLKVDRRREGSLAYWRISAPEGSLEPVTDPTPA
jgi:hypothetical protein